MRRAFLLVMGFASGLLILACLIFNMSMIFSRDYKSTSAGTESLRPGVQYVEHIPPADLTLPLKIPGTDLVAEKLILYEGGFLEDGSNEEVVDIIGLEIRNTGKSTVTACQVILERDGISLSFLGTYIPTDCSVMVLESERKTCPFQNFTGCRGSQTIENENWLRESDLSIVPVSMGSIRITNQTDHILQGLVLYYKNYLPYSKMYVGGITHQFRINLLKPGQSAEIFPERYAKDYSRILGVTAKSPMEPG